MWTWRPVWPPSTSLSVGNGICLVRNSHMLPRRKRHALPKMLLKKDTRKNTQKLISRVGMPSGMTRALLHCNTGSLHQKRSMPGNLFSCLVSVYRDENNHWYWQLSALIILYNINTSTFTPRSHLMASQPQKSVTGGFQSISPSACVLVFSSSIFCINSTFLPMGAIWCVQHLCQTTDCSQSKPPFYPLWGVMYEYLHAVFPNRFSLRRSLGARLAWRAHGRWE